MTDRALLLTAIQDTADELERRGVVFGEFKRRDRKEPARREKEQAEDALMTFFRRRFRRQAKRLRERLAQFGYKQAYVPLEDLFRATPEELALLIRHLTQNVQGGISLFGQQAGFDIDYSLTNVEAADWAREYGGKLITDIDRVTLDAVRKAVPVFVETPGFTMRDLMDMLPFDEKRAFRVATTEVTNSYKQGQILAGEQMKAEFPDVKVIKTWFTNNDALVCPLCGPLDAKEKLIEEDFYDPQNVYQDGNPPRHVNCRCWIITTTALADL
jgi:hypothetical protein